MRPSDFSTFFSELNDGHLPFPWQERLAQHIFSNGWTHDCLDLPTGSGKTAVLEIALYHLALEASKGNDRKAPLRIVFVVDRRLVVDQAAIRAKRIRDRLAGQAGIAGEVGKRLRDCFGVREALSVQTLRGGMPREGDWARTPTQPTILLSTVDQIGSRLLFRGYGVSDSMKPVHAGLLGTDCLIFLDEAHLSEPFRQTLGWVERYRQAPWSKVTFGPWHQIRLSATPGEAGDRFTIDDADRANAVLAPRLGASKTAELCTIGSNDLHKEYAAKVRAYAEQARTMLVVVNRLKLARDIWTELKGEFEGTCVKLLTGRSRELERTEQVREVEELLNASDGRLIVVATQCVEAGADYDFDALVTQIAPLDALRQRFGRLNRKGRPIKTVAAILASKPEVKLKEPDPVYGMQAERTWNLLQSIAVDGKVDFGIEALGRALQGVAQPAQDRANAPVMLPAYVDLLAQTSPVPFPSPEVPLFLHGPQSGPADVSVVWRSDLDISADSDERIIGLLTLVPPRPSEAVLAPLVAVKAWLRDRPQETLVSDVEGAGETSERGQHPAGRNVFRWRGARNPASKLISPKEIAPGDVIVVPSSYGGCKLGWAPREDSPVTDLGTAANMPFWRDRAIVRLHPKVPLAGDWQTQWMSLATALDAGDLNFVTTEVCGFGLSNLSQSDSAEGKIVYYYSESEDARQGVILSIKRANPGSAEAEASTEDPTSGDFTGNIAQSLTDHTALVTRKSNQSSEILGLPERIRKSIEFAAEHHDWGKGDRRFQQYLCNGWPETLPLAKSNRNYIPRKERLTWQACGLPEDWRHEALSVRMAICRLEEHADLDHELALWLIGTHHGYGRPFFPHDDTLDETARRVTSSDGKDILVPKSDGPQRTSFDWRGMDWAELFQVLKTRYGAWELARLEAIMRLADHRASEEGATS